MYHHRFGADSGMVGAINSFLSCPAVQWPEGVVGTEVGRFHIPQSYFILGLVT